MRSEQQEKNRQEILNIHKKLFYISEQLRRFDDKIKKNNDDIAVKKAQLERSFIFNVPALLVIPILSLSRSRISDELKDLEMISAQLRYEQDFLKQELAILLVEKEKQEVLLRQSQEPCTPNTPKTQPCMSAAEVKTTTPIEEARKACDAIFGKQSLVYAERAAVQTQTPWTANFFRDFCNQVSTFVVESSVKNDRSDMTLLY